MSEEKKPVTGQSEGPAQVDKLPKSKRTALVRYLAILFVSAFVIVLLSLYLQYRSTTSKKISDLTSMSNSAVANASQLQEENRALEQTVTEMEQNGIKLQEEHQKELADQRLVYDALVRLLSDPEKSDDPKYVEDPKVAEDLKTVQDGQDKLSESAKEAFAAYAEEIGINKTEEAKHD